MPPKKTPPHPNLDPVYRKEVRQQASQGRLEGYNKIARGPNCAMRP